MNFIGLSVVVLIIVSIIVLIGDAKCVAPKAK